MQRQLIFFMVFMILIITTACSPNKKSLLKEYIDAHNSKDINRALSHYSDDISFELVGVWTKNGKDKIRELEEWDVATNSHLNIETQRENGDTLFCIGDEQNDWFKAVGIPKVQYESIVFIFDGHLIRKIIARPHKEVNEQVGKAMRSILEFANKTNNEVISELLPNGEFVYSREAAVKWKKLLEDWNKNKSK